MRKLKISRTSSKNLACYLIIIIAFAVLYPMQMGGLLSNSLSGQLIPICAYIVMAISLNLTVGILGELSLGHAGFMSVGAFSGIIAAGALQNVISSDPLRLFVSILIGGIFAGILGILIGVPVLRLRGDYLAIVTLAFGEIIKNIVNCIYVGYDASGLHISMKDAASLGMSNGKILLNGAQGATGIPKLSTFPAGIILILVTLFVVLNLINSRSGRAVMALRDNRIAAESVGINVAAYKLKAFMISAAFAGMAGVLYAMNYSTIVAKKFDFNTSILVLVFVVLGGMGNILGSIIATTLLYMLPELLREYADYRMIIYAVILVLVMILTNSPKAKQMVEKATGAVRRLLTNKKGKGEVKQ